MDWRGAVDWRGVVDWRGIDEGLSSHVGETEDSESDWRSQACPVSSLGFEFFEER
jgi:hypothetical protein